MGIQRREVDLARRLTEYLRVTEKEEVFSLEIYPVLADRLDERIADRAVDAIALSEDLAAHPEISGEEHESSRKIVALLEGAGFSLTYPYADLETAFRATRGGGGPRVALLVEYDALPELGHGCGHNLHGAMSVLAALGLADLIDDVGGTLDVVGTPAEETDGAKCSMADKGLFDGYDLALMIHSGSQTSMAAFRSLAMDGYRFTFRGKAAHAAASPWEGRNALNGLQLLFHAVDMLRQHCRPEARLHGVIDIGGRAPNIVPEKALCRFELRAPTRGYLDDLRERVFDCARGAALATATEVSWEKFESSFDEMVPNEVGEALIEELFEELSIPFTAPAEPAGSTDMGNVSRRCPALHPILAITPQACPLHTREFARAVVGPQAHRALLAGGRILGRAVLKTLLDSSLREAMRASWVKNRG